MWLEIREVGSNVVVRPLHHVVGALVRVRVIELMESLNRVELAELEGKRGLDTIARKRGDVARGNEMISR